MKRYIVDIGMTKTQYGTVEVWANTPLQAQAQALKEVVEQGTDIIDWEYEEVDSPFPGPATELP